MAAHVRTYSRLTKEVLTLLGAHIRLARKSRRMSEKKLADRIGVARSTLRAIERGDPGVAVGLVFEAAVIVGVPLFVSDASRIGTEIERVGDKLALLPHSIRQPRKESNDDF